jgi:hypothetical protein
MTSPIITGSFLVGGVGFPDWFNTQVYGKPDFHSPIDGDQFTTIFDHVADLWAPEISVEQFVAFFCIFYNETGGSLKPIAELGGPRYCFETHLPGGGSKRSYNTAPNRLAGDQLVERGVTLSDAQRIAWNGKVWPGGDADLLAHAEECDFYKYRGRGLIQTTWRSTYLAQVDPLLLAAGFPSCDAMSTADLDAAVLRTPSVYLGMVKAFFAQMPTAFAAVDRRQWAPVGAHVSGSPAYGAGIYTRRCSMLCAAMDAAGVAASDQG